MKTLQFLFFTLVVLVLTSNKISAQTWNTIGNSGFSDGIAIYQRIALIENIPYVAYIDRALSDKVTVMSYNGTSWEPVGSKAFTADKASFLDFQTDDGQLFIAFCDYSVNRRASVMTFDGESWNYVGSSGFTPSIADVVSLYVENGTPWLAFQDALENSKVSVMKYEGGTWNLVGEAGFSTGFLTNVINLQVENGVPYVVYRDYDADLKTTVMKFENDTWQIVGQQGFSGGTYDSYHGLAVRNGIPYVAGVGESSEITVYSFDGNSWLTVGDAEFSESYANFIDIKFSANGDLYALYKDSDLEKKVILKKFIGNNWEQVGEPVMLGDIRFNSLALYESPNGEIIPYVAYQEVGYLGSKTSVKKFDVAAQIETLNDELLTVFPNPASDYLTIDFKGDFSKLNVVEIRSVLGQLVKTQIISKDQLKTINISDLSSGIYMVRLMIGEKTYNRKFTIH